MKARPRYHDNRESTRRNQSFSLFVPSHGIANAFRLFSTARNWLMFCIFYLASFIGILIDSPRETAIKRDKNEEKRLQKTSNLVDVGTQTDILLEDTMIIIMPSGTFFKLDGISQKRTEEEFLEDPDWGSELLANASVTILPLEDQLSSTRDRISTDDDSGIQMKSITRFSLRSSASSLQSISQIERMIAAPPGFSRFNSPDDSFIPEEDGLEEDDLKEPLTEKMPKARSNNRTFDIWRSQSAELGERFVDLLTSGDVSKLCDEDDCVIF